MDSKSGQEGGGDGGINIPKESDENSKMKGDINTKDMMFRADKIDLKSLDMLLEKHLNLVWSKNIEKQRPVEAWEVDLSKIDLRYVIAHGTYGTVYRATYDNKDVAGASMGTSNLTITSADGHDSLPSRACCVVVEYLPGGTLKQYLIRNRRKKLALKVVIQLALDLSRGLSYLHARKIVHRDVKTENLLLDAHRNVKIADFGVARVEAWNPSDMTGETGTLGYMAPEVLNGKPYNRKCDVYSFGICLWEIYCCDMPFPDLSFVQVSSAVVQENLRPAIPRCCPSSLANIMRKCWDANPKNRPEMEDVVKMLEAVNTSKGGGMIPEDKTPSCFCLAPRGP
ncbi:hypothetical protein Gohar_008277 [Gossypium harknessii]|uniref:non-specific serine/threonine protein kinase n=1 Tax=Gossypium harknessii TaxID=34285 RepID=A0A7J9GJ59_9ROSI|nr:hypothetical protein [Gossypium harknessii]